jgi:hypothetical protein
MGSQDFWEWPMAATLHETAGHCADLKTAGA